MPKTLVYLDTQDYSNIADALAGRRHANLLPVYEQLTRIADGGYFRFCFSQVLVSELLQVVPSSFDIARRKAEVVERLCGTCAFPNPFWLLKHQLANIALARGGTGIPLTPSPMDIAVNGRWLEQELQESAQQSFNPFSGLHWLLRPFAKLILRRISDERLRSFLSQVSLYQFLAAAGLEDVFLDTVKQRIDGVEMMRRIGMALAYPTKLMWQPEVASTIVNLNTSIREFGDRMMETLNNFRSQIDDARQRIGAPLSRQMIEVMYPAHAAQLWTNVARRTLLEEQKTHRSYLLSEQFATDVSGSEFVRYFADIMVEVFVEMASASSVRRRVRRSDGGDLLHSLYIPYCRVFRADAGFSSVARNVGLRYGCAVVGDLVALPEVLLNIQAAEQQSV